jgi:hypothetical protein
MPAAPQWVKRDRNLRLILFYHEGNSMRETADRFSLSLERVRQILVRDAPHVIRPQGIQLQKWRRRK